MFRTLIFKELESILFSPKFTATFAVCSLLMLLSVFVGIREFQSTSKQYAAANDLVQQEMREARGWMMVNNRVYREPNPLQVFASGIQNDIGRYSSISSWEPVKLVHSSYSDDPLFAVFRFVDFAFIVQVVLTLFAILFTYDAVSGERESGTLQLIFSNAVPRAQYIAAKFIGSWLGMVIPLAVPVLLSLSLLFVFGVHLTGEQWARLASLIGVSVLLFTFFIAFGIFVSAVTRRSNVSFLISLVCWVAFVLIIPRVGVMLSGQFVKVPTVAEIESQQDGFAKDRWNQHMKELTETWRGREELMKGLNDEQRKAKRDELEWAWAEQDDKLRKAVQRDIDENSRKLTEESRNRKLVQERLAFALSRVSPVSAFQLAVMNLAATDINVKNRAEDALTAFRSTFNQYKEQKQKESGGIAGLRISVDSNKGVKIDVGREIALDLSGLPQYQPVNASFGQVVALTLPDIGILGICSLLAFAGAFVSFLKYDVR
jgi:ABC-type transport system involved in multi-copper enzyme maturation permease subunit